MNQSIFERSWRQLGLQVEKAALRQFRKYCFPAWSWSFWGISNIISISGFWLFVFNFVCFIVKNLFFSSLISVAESFLLIVFLLFFYFDYIYSIFFSKNYISTIFYAQPQRLAEQPHLINRQSSMFRNDRDGRMSAGRSRADLSLLSKVLNFAFNFLILYFC